MSVSESLVSGPDNEGERRLGGEPAAGSPWPPWVEVRRETSGFSMSRPPSPGAATFRMSRPNVDYLYTKLTAAIAKEDAALRAAIPVRQHVVVCVRCLAMGEPLSNRTRCFPAGHGAHGGMKDARRERGEGRRADPQPSLEVVVA